MKVKKNTINVLLVITFLVTFGIASFRIIQVSRVQAFLNERNEVCANLSFLLSEDESIDECFCFFEGFKTGDSAVDDRTLPLCACECVVNGTKVSVGLLEPAV